MGALGETGQDWLVRWAWGGGGFRVAPRPLQGNWMGGWVHGHIIHGERGLGSSREPMSWAVGMLGLGCL